MSQINSYIKDYFQVVLLLSCFVGHPVCIDPVKIKMSKNDINNLLTLIIWKCVLCIVKKGIHIFF